MNIAVKNHSKSSILNLSSRINLKKKIIITIFIALLTLILYLIFSHQEAPQVSLYQRISTKIDHVAVKRSPTPEEIKIAQIASLPQKEVNERIVEPPLASTEGLQYLNQIDSKWEERLVSNLLAFQAPETKVIVQHVKSLLIVKKEGLRYAEEVIVSYQNEKQLTGGFTALVDSQSGKIIKTWNRMNWLIPSPPFELPEIK